MSAPGESPADEDPGVANPDENNIDADPTKDISDAETEPAMLEEEEMPTYMSLTSSSRPDESRADINAPRPSEDVQAGEERASSPYSSEQGAESVCVLSSGDESIRRPYDDMMEDSYSDEMDMDEEDEEDDSCMNDEEEETDGDIEPEQFERSSDDFVLRYDGGLEKHHKERSRSLQDLNNSRGNLSRFVGKRRSIDRRGGYEIEFPIQNIEICKNPLADRKKVPRSIKYDHVPSKVKMYIHDLKEQSRRSAERRSRENTELKNFSHANAKGDSIDIVTCTKLNPANKLIKNYVQNAMNEMVTEKQSKTKEHEIYNNLTENNPDINTISMAKEARETTAKEKYARDGPIAENSSDQSDNIANNGKANGLIDNSMQNHNAEIVESMETCASNGQEQIAAILNLRSLSYEEYTNGEETPKVKDDIENVACPTFEEKNGVIEYEEEVVGISEIEESKLVDPLQPAISKTRQIVPNEIQDESQRCQRLMNEKLEEMSAMLIQKNAQIDSMREAYQKTLIENMSLKRELIELKKTLEQSRVKNEPPETKVVSVQTETAVEIVQTTTIFENATKPPMTKLLSSTVTSALSSMEQWSDSNCSAAISIDPPNMDTALNSDESMIGCERTPRKTLRPLSQSFITSSRILQTLANITQGRTKTTSPLVDGMRTTSHLDAEPGQSKRQPNTPHSSMNEESTVRAKKRKASDMLGVSDSSHPFKMPHTPGDSRKKMNSDSDTDGVFKTDHQTKTSDRKESNDDSDNRDGNAERTSEDFDDTEATDVPENVKCFVYQEEPDSKERSFLIQADDVSKSDQASDKAGTIRECGPFLLGNVEIRMSEANGTINLWGKEVSRSSENPDVDIEMEEFDEYERPSFAARSSHECQHTPRTKIPSGNTFVCSTNKKSRFSPQLARSGIAKYLRPGFSNLMRTNHVASESESGHCAGSPFVENRTGCECCETHEKRVKWPSCEHITNSRVKQHSCCLPDVEANERDCDCSREHEVFNEQMFEVMSNILDNYKKCTAALHNVGTKHTCGNDDYCRNHGSHRRHSPAHEDDFNQGRKRCSSCAAELPTYNTRLTPKSVHCRGNRSHSHSHVSCDDEEHPLILNDAHGETPETKRRRMSGKKFRGILTDLLRGCGGCRDPNSTSNLATTSAGLQTSVPKVRISPCPSPQTASCSKRPTSCQSRSNHPSNDFVNEKCRTSCSHHSGMRTEIENQLEILRVDVERLRSRSDAFLEMLNLLNVETD